MSDGYPYGMALYHCHPSQCRKRGCKAGLREILIETKHKSRSSCEIECLVSRDRVLKPKDHAGAFCGWGPGFADGRENSEKMQEARE